MRAILARDVWGSLITSRTFASTLEAARNVGQDGRVVDLFGY